MNRKTKLLDIAEALGVSTGTVHRALRNHPGVSPVTKARVQQMAKMLGYRPNLAARYLSSKRSLRISVNTPQGTSSFWDEVRAGIQEGARARVVENVEVEYRTYPRQGQGDERAFEEALKAGVDGIITFPIGPQSLHSCIRRASRGGTPVACVAADAPATGRLAVVSIDSSVSGSLAADLMGGLAGGRGKVAVVVNSLKNEQAEKYEAFGAALLSLYSRMQVLGPIEDHHIESEGYEKSLALFKKCPDLVGVYVTNETSIPIVNAARDADMLNKITFITTDLFPALVPEIRSHGVAATIYERPRTQGRMAFRVLYEFLVEGECPSFHVALPPHLIMRGNLDFFLQRQSLESDPPKGARPPSAAAEVVEHLG